MLKRVLSIIQGVHLVMALNRVLYGEAREWAIEVRKEPILTCLDLFL